MRRKRKEIVRAALDLAGQLAMVTDGSYVRRKDGSRSDVSAYAHGAAVALGLLAHYASGGAEPTVTGILGAAVDWSAKIARDVAEHPDDVTQETIDLRGEASDHE